MFCFIFSIFGKSDFKKNNNRFSYLSIFSRFISYVVTEFNNI